MVRELAELVDQQAMTNTGASLRATASRSTAVAVTESDSRCRFEVICEVEPPTRPDLTRVRHQIGVLSHVADSFLIPDNHIGRATVSSVAVAHEVQAMGARGIACLNSRDRNLLGFRRDLLTAAAYGVDRFLYVYGDKPSAGGRTSELTVRTMIEETRAAAEDPMFTGLAPFRAGVTCGLRAVPTWKATADFVFAQVSYSLESLLRWRESVQVSGPVYAGVMVLASAAMARNLAGTIPGIDIPADLVTAVERDRNAGVEAACQQVLAIRDSGAFDGVHLVPVSRYRQVAALLETELRPSQRSWRL
jgi:5,10-methylenetetrahydrofolate reductase